MLKLSHSFFNSLLIHVREHVEESGICENLTLKIDTIKNILASAVIALSKLLSEKPVKQVRYTTILRHKISDLYESNDMETTIINVLCIGLCMSRMKKGKIKHCMKKLEVPLSVTLLSIVY